MKRIVVYLIFIVVIFINIIPHINSDDSIKGITLYVGGTGVGNYSTIQNAIDASSSGDTVFIFNGIYYENINIYKTINIIGEDKTNTIIDGGSNGSVLYIFAGYNKISNLTLKNGGIIFEHSPYIEIFNNNIINSGISFSLVPSDDISIHHNVLFSSGISTYTYGHNNLIYNNRIECNGYGVSLASSDKLYNNYIANNTIGVKSYGNEMGGSPLIINNTIINNSQYGILSDCCISRTTIINNTISNNGEGIHISHSSDLIHGNYIFNNTNWGIFIEENLCYNGNIIYNNFFNNPNNAYANNSKWNIDLTSGKNILDGNIIGGNYWSDYNGLDSNSDGIGDIPYNISGGNKQDMYPLMYTIPDQPIYVWVDDNYNSSTIGWQYDHFNVIQDGIDAVSENGTVYVYNGTYYEHVIVNKTINLTSRHRYGAIIDGEGGGDVIYISSDFVNIYGFTIINGGNNWRNGGIDINSNNNGIWNNKIINNGNGIIIFYQIGNNISNNIIKNGTIGLEIFTGTGTNIIYNNHVEFQSNCGVYLAEILLSLNNSKNDIIHNYITFNNISNSGSGIKMDSGYYNIISNNNIYDNQNYGIRTESYSSSNTIFHNNFFNNSIQAFDSNNNSWDNGYPSGGNYWDDYTGTDANSDGIGDTPYYIIGGSNQDNYPLGYFHPIVDYTFSPTNPTRLDVIQFTDTSFDPDGTIVNWSWSFGDGYVSSLQNPTHQYNNIGTYQVNFTIWDDENKMNTTQKMITIINSPPVANFSYTPLNPDVGEIVLFSDNSFDPDGNITSWLWNFDDSETSSEQHPTHIYDSSGRYQVTLTITDDKNISDSITKLVPVGMDIVYNQDLSAGWNFVSLPFNGSLSKTDFILKYDGYYYGLNNGIINPFMFQWKRIGQTYDFANVFNPGFGYWVFAYEDCELWLEEFIPNTDSYITLIEPSWNIIGLPFDQSIDKIDLLVDGVSWNTAVSNGWVNNYVYGWDRTGQYYTFADIFNPGYSYWVFATQSCTLKRNT